MHVWGILEQVLLCPLPRRKRAMSAQDESGERTELPTEKRFRDACEQGRSRELATAAVF